MHLVSVLRVLGRLIAGIIIGLLILGIIALAPIAGVALGLITLSSVPLSEAVLISASVIVLTIGFWGGIWYSEKQGWAQLIAEQGRPDEPPLEEGDEKDDDSGIEV